MVSPLDDILVIEIDNWMASPSAGAILADLGARVIKIEPPSGDTMRNMGRAPKIDSPLNPVCDQPDFSACNPHGLWYDWARRLAARIRCHRIFRPIRSL